MFLSSHLTIIAFHEQFEVMSPTALLELLLIITTHVPTAHEVSHHSLQSDRSETLMFPLAAAYSWLVGQLSLPSPDSVYIFVYKPTRVKPVNINLSISLVSGAKLICCTLNIDIFHVHWFPLVVRLNWRKLFSQYENLRNCTSTLDEPHVCWRKNCVGGGFWELCIARISCQESNVSSLFLFNIRYKHVYSCGVHPH